MADKISLSVSRHTADSFYRGCSLIQSCEDGKMHLKGLLSTVLVHAGKPSAGKLGKFLVQAQFQGSVHSSALFLTAAAQNLLCMKLASELGVNIPNPWVTWFKGALVPAALGLMITPLLIFKVCFARRFLQTTP